MRYILCKTEKAMEAGMNIKGRLKTEDGKLVMLNESGVMNCRELMEETLEGRVEWLEGEIMEDKEAEARVKDMGMKV